MPTEVTLPRLGQGMESGTIVRWLKAEGEAVARDEPLYEIDTEKVTQEVESPVAGTVLRIVAAEGAEVPVGELIAWIGEPGEAVPAEPEGSAAGDSRPAVPDAAPAEHADEGAGLRESRRASERAAAEAAVGIVEGERIKASPLARRMARERGLDLTTMTGTGPDGRIVAEDVERAAQAPAAPAAPAPAAPAPAAPAAPGPAAVAAAGESIQLTSVRRTIARRLTEAWQAPHFALSMSADMRRVIELRERLVERTADGEPRPTYSDVLTKLCALALLRHPDMNAHYLGDQVRRFGAAHIGIAVAIPNGLVVPVIRDADRRSIPEIAVARADVVARTRDGKLQTADLEGGTFTISNLGMYGVESFFAVLNPPQVGILAVGSIEDRVVAESGQPMVRPRMEMTLSCDHRGVDGATAAEFLRTLKELLEEPALAL